MPPVGRAVWTSPVDLHLARLMPPTQFATETILEALIDRLESALDLAVSGRVETEFPRIASLCRNAAALAEAGAIIRDPDA
jgi:hypothetical protein